MARYVVVVVVVSAVVVVVVAAVVVVVAAVVVVVAAVVVEVAAVVVKVAVGGGGASNCGGRWPTPPSLCSHLAIPRGHVYERPPCGGVRLDAERQLRVEDTYRVVEVASAANHLRRARCVLAPLGFARGAPPRCKRVRACMSEVSVITLGSRPSSLILRSSSSARGTSGSRICVARAQVSTEGRG